MAEWHHLYDPVNDIHYINGGYIMPGSPVPTDGLEWRQGRPVEHAGEYIVQDNFDKAAKVLDMLTPEIKAKYYKDIVLIREAISAKDYSVIPLLLGKVQPETQPEQVAFEAISNLLGG